VTSTNRTLIYTAIDSAIAIVEKALPKFNWGASALDAEAIQALNDGSIDIRAAAQNLQQIRNKPEVHHYFASTAFDWATATTRAEAVRKVAKRCGRDMITAQVKAHGGLYVWTCRVDAAEKSGYAIRSYAPHGVPTCDAREYRIVNASGAVAVDD
jgi:hypothetical protein